MLYIWLKYIHILSSTILFGTGIGTASVMFYGHLSKNMNAMAVINRYVVLVDWIFTGTSGLVQPVTGFWLIYIAGYSLTSHWIVIGILGYLIAAICWFPVVYLQIKIRDITEEAVAKDEALPSVYYVYFKWWFALGWPAFISLMLVFYMMVAKPF